LFLAVAVLVGGCSSKSSSSADARTTTTAAITSTTTSAAAPPATLPPLHLTSAFTSATHLIDAWKSNDRVAAAQAATAAAVNALFAQAYQPLQSRGCDGAQPESDCFYREGRTGGVRLHVTRQGDGSWVVTEASLNG
jgi:hypothetical protein